MVDASWLKPNLLDDEPVAKATLPEQRSVTKANSIQ
jgi:hypothetical protein